MDALQKGKRQNAIRFKFRAVSALVVALCGLCGIGPKLGSRIYLCLLFRAFLGLFQLFLFLFHQLSLSLLLWSLPVTHTSIAYRC